MIDLHGVYYDQFGDIKIICFVGKTHVAARRKRCSPFLVSRKTFLSKYKLKEKINE